MFSEGDILYFSPFYFKNGNKAKNKYFVVLKNIGNKALLAVLPTRKDSIPDSMMIDSGCVEASGINFNCFVFSEHTEVTECGKCFDFRTHLYGSQIDDYDISFINNLYPHKDKDYVLWGRMKVELYEALIDCFCKSSVVKRKYRRELLK